MRSLEPVIFVGLGSVALSGIESEAERFAVTIARIDLNQAHDRATMIAVVSAAVGLTAMPQGLDAAIDDLADGQLLANSHGYLWLASGLDSLLDRAPEAFDDFMQMLPMIGDRWRSAGRPYVVAVSAVTPMARQRAIDKLEEVNRLLDEAGKQYSWAEERRIMVLTRASKPLPWTRT